MTLKEKIIRALAVENGLTDRELTDKIIGINLKQQPVNQACRSLESEGLIIRHKGQKNRLQNFIMSDPYTITKLSVPKQDKPIEEPVYQSKTEICFDGYNLKELTILYSEFDLVNVFAQLRNNTVLNTISKPRYLKLKDTVLKEYPLSLDKKIGEFLLHLKSSGDTFYNQFLNSYGDEFFCKFEILYEDLFTKKGLYFYKLSDEIVYIGRCRDNFRKRFNSGYGRISPKNCYIDGQSTNCRINALINKNREKLRIFVCELDDEQEIITLERKLGV